MHPGESFCKVLRHYLRQEWLDKKAKTALSTGENIEFNPTEGTSPFVKCNVWRQENGTDCGVYVVKFAQFVCLHWPNSSMLSINTILKDFFKKANCKFDERDSDAERVLMLSYIDMHIPIWVAIRKEADEKRLEEKKKKKEKKILEAAALEAEKEK